MERGRTQRNLNYTERHHVVPKCLGGGNDKTNIVRLTPEEHYVAHQLLVKLYPHSQGLAWAVVGMTAVTKNQPGRKNKMYGWLRKRYAASVSERCKGKPLSMELRAKLSAAKLGKKRWPHTTETKSKMSAASLGRPKSAAHCAALGLAKKGKKCAPFTLLHRQRMSAGIKAAFQLKKQQSNNLLPIP